MYINNVPVMVIVISDNTTDSQYHDRQVHIFLFSDFRMSANSFDCCDKAMEVDASPCPVSYVFAVPMEVDDPQPSSRTTSTAVPIKKTKKVRFNSTVTVASYNALATTYRGCKLEKTKKRILIPNQKKDYLNFDCPYVRSFRYVAIQDTKLYLNSVW